MELGFVVAFDRGSMLPVGIFVRSTGTTRPGHLMGFSRLLLEADDPLVTPRLGGLERWVAPRRGVSHRSPTPFDQSERCVTLLAVSAD